MQPLTQTQVKIASCKTPLDLLALWEEMMEVVDGARDYGDHKLAESVWYEAQEVAEELECCLQACQDPRIRHAVTRWAKDRRRSL